MIALIRRALDANRLAKQLEQAEAEIVALKAELSTRINRPNFREVAREFDASAIFSQLADKVIADLSPFLQQEAISLLKTAFKGLRTDRMVKPSMYAMVAEDYTERAHHFKFETNRMGTTVTIHNGAMNEAKP
jgi:hypothetical protein